MKRLTNIDIKLELLLSSLVNHLNYLQRVKAAVHLKDRLTMVSLMCEVDDMIKCNNSQADLLKSLRKDLNKWDTQLKKRRKKDGMG